MSDLTTKAAEIRAGLVKPLVWDEYETEGEIDRWDAQTMMGAYYEIGVDFNGYLVSHDYAHLNRAYETLEEAKAAAQADYESRIRSSLQPDTQAAAASATAGDLGLASASVRPEPTEVDAWKRLDGGLNADWIAMILSEDARIEDGKLANPSYLAVKIAGAADLPAEVVRLRKALAHIRDHTRETTTATMAIGALSSAPAQEGRS